MVTLISEKLDFTTFRHNDDLASQNPICLLDSDVKHFNPSCHCCCLELIFTMQLRSTMTLVVPSRKRIKKTKLAAS